jgi:hypothetical protein
MVIAVELSSGSTISGVLGGATNESLILKGWAAEGPNEEMFVIDWDFVQRLLVF